MAQGSCIVLGGGGFLGTNLCRRLVSSGLRVRAFGRRRLFPEALRGIEWYQGDFSDSASLAVAIESFDVVFHLIHSTTPQSSILDMAGRISPHVPPSLPLLRVAREPGVRRST